MSLLERNVIMFTNPSMKRLTLFILRKYSKVSGEKKIRLAMSLSEMVRDVRKAGKAQMGA